MRWMLYLLLALSPLPLASARPVWQWLWVTFVGVLFLTQFVTKRKHKKIKLPATLNASFVMVLIFVGWGLIQAWAPIGANLQSSLAPVSMRLEQLATISVSPARTLSVSIFFLSHALFGYSVFRYIEHRADGVQLVRFCGLVSLAYAAYGFTVYVSGNETVLWYEKWASFGALTSSFVNRNSYSAFAGLGLQCLTAYAIFWTQDELSENRKGRELYRHILETIIQKAWWLPIAILVTATVVILTHSRAGFLSAALAVFALAILSPNRYQRTVHFRKSLVGYSAVLATAVGLFYMSGELLDARLQGETSNNLRFQNYPYVIAAIQDRPILGYGLGAFDNVHLTYRVPDDLGWFSRAHSDHLELVHTAGTPAAVWLVIALLSPVVFLLRQLKFGLQYRTFIALGITTSLQFAIHSAVDFSLQMPAVSYLWVAILATSSAMAYRCKLSQQAN